jgi:hexosaminidase
VILLPQPRRAAFGTATVDRSEPAMRRDPSLPAEGYRLRIGDGGVTVDAADDAGEFYARATLAQLAQQTGGRLPVGEVDDWPDLGVRGAMLDISRDKVPTMETLEALIDRLASWKVNQVQLYMEHTFASAGHEDVWREASPVTPEELRRLDAYCRERHVELVPNQNCLGHWDRWLRHARYRPLAMSPDGYEERGRHREPTTIAPGEPALALVRDVLGQLLPNLTSRRVHVGLDEPWEMDKEDLEPYLDWVRALRAMPELDGREMLMWGDILAGRADLISRLPEGTTVCEWWYEAGWDWSTRGATYVETGRKWWACPGTSSWTTILGRWDNATGNISDAVDGALAAAGEGLLVTDWGDRGHLQYLPISDPGLAWAAAQSWCRSANRDLDLPAALDAHCYDDGAGVIGGVLHDLGNVHLAIKPQFFNMSTLVFHLYFPQLQVGRTFTEGITHEQVASAEGILAGCRSRLDGAHPGRADGALVVEELRTAIDLVALICRDLHARLDADGWLASVPEPARLELAGDLDPLIDGHRRMWLARNRPGGLPDSEAWLTNLATSYRTGHTDKGWGGW